MKRFTKILFKGIIIFSIGFVVLFFLRGGIYFTSNVSTSEELWGGYKYQHNYLLLRDVFLKRSYQGMACPGRLVLVPESSLKGHPGRHESSPDTISTYKANPHRDFFIVGIVAGGTRLRTIRLDKHAGFNWFYGHVEELTPYAEILDGPYAGKKVDITDISYYYQKDDKGIFMYKPEDGVIALSEK